MESLQTGLSYWNSPLLPVHELIYKTDNFCPSSLFTYKLFSQHTAEMLSEFGAFCKPTSMSPEVSISGLCEGGHKLQLQFQTCFNPWIAIQRLLGQIQKKYLDCRRTPPSSLAPPSFLSIFHAARHHLS